MDGRSGIAGAVGEVEVVVEGVGIDVPVVEAVDVESAVLYISNLLNFMSSIVYGPTNLNLRQPSHLFPKASEATRSPSSKYQDLPTLLYCGSFEQTLSLVSWW